MDNKPKIGIIGYGFLGKAFMFGFSQHAILKIYDKYNNIYNSLNNAVNHSDFLMVGVPTPMKKDGGQDLSNIKDAVKQIISVAKSNKIIIIRSTIIPGTTRYFANKYPKHSFLFHPEFLTERNANLDFINAARIIIGHEQNNNLAAKKLKEIYRYRFPNTLIYLTSWETAELVKYISNSFFAVKLSFLNEIYDIAKSIGISYPELIKLWLADNRIGDSHTNIPGHDGYRGYGGKCLPKDIQAFIHWAEGEGLSVEMCKTAGKINRKIRLKEDWLEIKGATSKNNYEE